MEDYTMGSDRYSILCLALLLWSAQATAAEVSPVPRLDNNLKCVDLSDLQDELPLGVVRDSRGYARWPMADGLITPWREGDKLYLFAGPQIHAMNLPVSRPKGGDTETHRAL